MWIARRWRSCAALAAGLGALALHGDQRTPRIVDRLQPVRADKHGRLARRSVGRFFQQRHEPAVLSVVLVGIFDLEGALDVRLQLGAVRDLLVTLAERLAKHERSALRGAGQVVKAPLQIAAVLAHEGLRQAQLPLADPLLTAATLRLARSGGIGILSAPF